MGLDYQQMREQVKQLGQSAPGREDRLKALRQRAWDLLQANANELEGLRQKVQTVVRSHDPSLRCALPAGEPLNAHAPPPPLPETAIVLAADGSQIYLDRHAAVEYFLINIGTLQMDYSDPQSPHITVDGTLYYGDDLNVGGAYPSEEKVSLLRDLRERQKLAELVEVIGAPVITLTDGRLELWGASPEEAGGEAGDQSLAAFLEALARLQAAGATAAGYVDKPSEDYLVRLLEVAWLPPEDARERPLLGVRDVDLFRKFLAPGERSAVFAVQSRSARTYRRRDEALAPHFFYLNVGRPGHPWLARVDILAWIAEDAHKLDDLHAVLLHQCSMLGSRPYPYALHRAHEIARVTPDEKDQLELMIANELRKQGVLVEQSHKQFLKSL
jgi:hypothetical protein